MANELLSFGTSGIGAFADPNLWLPAGVAPRSGQHEHLVIVGGELVVTSQPWDDYDVRVANPAIIDFTNETLGNASVLSQDAPTATYTIAGTVNNTGTIHFGSAGHDVTATMTGTQFFGRFINNGTVDVHGNLVANNALYFVNNGTVQIEHGTAQFAYQGTEAPEASYVLGPEGTLSLTGYGGGGKVAFAPGSNGHLVLTNPYIYSAPTVSGFDAGDDIRVPGLVIAENYATGADHHGTLILSGANGAEVARISVVGDYTADQFAFAADVATGTTTITTTYVDGGGRSESTDAVLDLSNHGYRDASITFNNSHDVTIKATNLLVHDSNIAQIKFLDGTVTYDAANPNGHYVPDPDASGIARMYYTVLGRAPEFAGEYFWVHDSMHGANQSLQAIATNFFQGREFSDRYGTGTTDDQFVTLLYKNILGRDPAGDPGFAFWTDAIHNGVSRAEVTYGISESKEHADLRAPVVEAAGIAFIDHPFL